MEKKILEKTELKQYLRKGLNADYNGNAGVIYSVRKSRYGTLIIDWHPVIKNKIMPCSLKVIGLENYGTEWIAYNTLSKINK